MTSGETKYTRFQEECWRIMGKTLDNTQRLWDHPLFEKHKKRIQEENSFIANPIEIEEGVLECGRCGSKKTFSYSKQTRGADEPMTTFATCVECDNEWTYSG
jgi:DNA-directed RNA polymerase subunit M/transcription elongation factor TFIIS